MCDYLKVDGTPCRRKGLCWQHQSGLLRGKRVAVTAIAVSCITTIALNVISNILTPQIKVSDLIAKAFSNPPEAKVASYPPVEVPNELATSSAVTRARLSSPSQEKSLAQASAEGPISQNTPANTGLIVLSGTQAFSGLQALPTVGSNPSAILSNPLTNFATVTGASFALPLQENLSTHDGVEALLYQNLPASAGLVIPASAEALPTLGVGAAAMSFQTATISNVLGNPVTATGAGLPFPPQENPSTKGSVEDWIHKNMPVGTGLNVPSDAQVFPGQEAGFAVVSNPSAIFSNPPVNYATTIDASFSLPQQQNLLTQDSVEMLTNMGMSASTGRVVLSNSLTIPKLEVGCPIASSGFSQ